MFSWCEETGAPLEGGATTRGVTTIRVRGAVAKRAPYKKLVVVCVFPFSVV